jgi:hypothetical protein
MPLSNNDCPDYCLDCVSKMSIRCAWCAEPIHVGDEISFYSPIEPYLSRRSPIIGHTKVGGRYIGCTKCKLQKSDSGPSGIWSLPGKVLAYPINETKELPIKSISNPSDLGKLV